jgi:hypothetical protein
MKKLYLIRRIFRRKKMAIKETYICDRCGKEGYEPVFHVYGNAVHLKDSKHRYRTLFEVRTCEQFVDCFFTGKDLCASCHQELADWWEKGKTCQNRGETGKNIPPNRV